MVSTLSARTTEARPAAEQSPLPTGPVWEWFTARHPQVDQSRIVRRWLDAAALYHTGHVSPASDNGSRIVRSQNADDPERDHTQPDSYTVQVAQARPRIYACSCPDYQYRGGSQGYCKHTLAVWHAVYYACTERMNAETAQRIVDRLIHEDAAALLKLLDAITRGHVYTALTVAADLTLAHTDDPQAVAATLEGPARHLHSYPDPRNAAPLPFDDDDASATAPQEEEPEPGPLALAAAA